MADHARSSDPGVQTQLDRLALLSPGRDILGLERITALLDRLGNPHERLPPVFHVAGTNGKGSTCAFLRAGIEAAGLTAHVYSSPHLVSFNERIRLAGTLIADDKLAVLLGETLDAAAGMEISFFEATTAAAFLAFARSPADACIVEVGLGGRLDATNVISAPLSCGIAQLGIDHQAFLGQTIEKIAAEKGGIAKPGAALLTQAYPDNLAAQIQHAAATVGARWLPRGGAWDAAIKGGALTYRDARGSLSLPLPRLAGSHQAMNAALAVAMLRHQSRLDIPGSALGAAMENAQWPARLQRLPPGPVRDLLPANAELWLDGAHNPAAAHAIAAHFRALGRPFHIVVGLLANKDAAGIVDAFRADRPTIHPVPVPGHDHYGPEALADIARAAGLEARSAASVADALGAIAGDAERAPVVLIMGSLYLAGAVLADNGTPPD